MSHWRLTWVHILTARRIFSGHIYLCGQSSSSDLPSFSCWTLQLLDNFINWCIIRNIIFPPLVYLRISYTHIINITWHPSSSLPVTPSILDGNNLCLPFMWLTSGHKSPFLSLVASANVLVQILPSPHNMSNRPVITSSLSLISVMSPVWGFPLFASVDVRMASPASSVQLLLTTHPGSFLLPPVELIFFYKMWRHFDNSMHIHWIN